MSIEAVGLANRETRYHSLRVKAVNVVDYFLGNKVEDLRKQENPKGTCETTGIKCTRVKNFECVQ